MLALFSAMGVDLPKADTVFALRTVLVSLLLGTGITLLATIIPARRATRVPPIAAVREGSTLPASRFAAHSRNTGLGVVAGLARRDLAGVFAGVGGGAVALLLGLGVLGLFLGIALLAPRLVKPLAHVVGWPARRAGGVAGELAGANAARNPAPHGVDRRRADDRAHARHGRGGARRRHEQVDEVGGHRPAPRGLRRRRQRRRCRSAAAEGDELAQVPGVTAASHVRTDKALVKGEEIDVTGIDPATIARFYTFEWVEGSDATLAQLGTDGALVTEELRRGNDLAVGGRLALQTPSGEKRTVVVRGDLRPAARAASCSRASASPRRRSTTRSRARRTRSRSSTPTPAPPRRSRATAKDSGDATLHTGAAYAKDATKDMATFLAMLYVLLGFSVVVSLFGMVNTLVLSVFERTRELGMLRAIGMTRRQARRMIRHESVITALIGAALGPRPRRPARGCSSPRRCRSTTSRCRCRCRRWPASRWSPSSPASPRRSSRHGGPRA